MSNTLVLGAVAALVIGLILFARSNKQRENNGEWSGSLQWGYLLMMVGVFGVLSSMMSFTAVLLIFVVFTGIVWFIHRGRLKKNDQAHRDNSHFTDYMSGFFPIILIVFLLRTFVAEPFQIPSSSMRPGLVVGDFILVNKFSYGIRTPIINNVLINTGSVKRGDVVVFNFPENPSVNYIKRAIGLPGDVIEYRNKVLSINGKALSEQETGSYNYQENTQQYGVVKIDADSYQQNLDGKTFRILKMASQPSFLPQGVRAEFPYRQNCEYAEDGSWFKCTVPQGNYFMMGDNRDNSEDSRYWGFVDDKLIVGKAFLIWLNLGDFSRVGTKIQ